MDRISSALRTFSPLSLLGLAFVIALAQAPPPAFAACGDAVLDSGEECDGSSVAGCGGGLCNSDCTCAAPGCGDPNADLFTCKNAGTSCSTNDDCSTGDTCVTGLLAADALTTLKKAVGMAVDCQDVRCDVNGTKSNRTCTTAATDCATDTDCTVSGDTCDYPSAPVKVTDALLILKRAVGITGTSTDLACPGVEIGDVTDLPSATDPVTASGQSINETLETAKAARAEEGETTATKIDLGSGATFFEAIASDSHKNVSIGACETVNRYHSALDWAQEGDKVLCYLSNIVGTQAPKVCSSSGASCTTVTDCGNYCLGGSATCASDADCTGDATCTAETCAPSIDIYDGNEHIIDMVMEHPGFCVGYSMVMDVDEIDTSGVDVTCRTDSDCASFCSDGSATCTGDSDCTGGATCASTAPCISFDQESGADNVRVKIKATRIGSTGSNISAFEMYACENTTGGSYAVPIIVYDETTLGSLQIAIDYSNATGFFEGTGIDIDCSTTLAAGGTIFIANDNDAAQVLSLGFIDLFGFSTARTCTTAATACSADSDCSVGSDTCDYATVATCTFTTTGGSLSAADFIVTVEDASDTAGESQRPTAGLDTATSSSSGQVQMHYAAQGIDGVNFTLRSKGVFSDEYGAGGHSVTVTAPLNDSGQFTNSKTIAISSQFEDSGDEGGSGFAGVSEETFSQTANDILIIGVDQGSFPGKADATGKADSGCDNCDNRLISYAQLVDDNAAACSTSGTACTADSDCTADGEVCELNYSVSLIGVGIGAAKITLKGALAFAPCTEETCAACSESGHGCTDGACPSVCSTNLNQECTTSSDCGGATCLAQTCDPFEESCDRFDLEMDDDGNCLEEWNFSVVEGWNASAEIDQEAAITYFNAIADMKICSTSWAKCTADSDCPSGESCQEFPEHSDKAVAFENVCSTTSSTTCTADADCPAGETCRLEKWDCGPSTDAELSIAVDMLMVMNECGNLGGDMESFSCHDSAGGDGHESCDWADARCSMMDNPCDPNGAGSECSAVCSGQKNPCSADTDCLSGETCTAQTCVESTSACDFEDPCDSNAPPPYCFDEDALDDFDPCDKKTCGDTGIPCQNDDDCAGGQTCASDGEVDSDAPPFCTGGGTAATGDCCKPNPDQGCSHFGDVVTDATADQVETCVCGKDEFCCGVDEDSDGTVDFGEWDGPCVALAHECLETYDSAGKGCFTAANDPCAANEEGVVPFWCTGTDETDFWEAGEDWGYQASSAEKGNCCMPTFGVKGCAVASGETATSGNYPLACQLDDGSYDSICEQICAFDSYCCEYEWDPPCVGAANAVMPAESQCFSNDATSGQATFDPCLSPYPPPFCKNMMDQFQGMDEGIGDCCMPNPTPGCENPGVEAAVCAADSFCCQVMWDGACVQQVDYLSETMDFGGFECFGDPCDSDYPPPFCYGDDASSFDPCDLPAEQQPDFCGSGTEGDCCMPNSGQGCNDAAVESCACAMDSFCCADSDGGHWDGACVGLAQSECNSGCFVEGSANDPCAPGPDGKKPFWCMDGSDWDNQFETDSNDPCFCPADETCPDLPFFCVGDQGWDNFGDPCWDIEPGEPIPPFCDPCSTPYPPMNCFGGTDGMTGQFDPCMSPFPPPFCNMGAADSAYGNCCYDHTSAGCDSAWPEIQTCVCDQDSFCCGNQFGYDGPTDGHWDGACVMTANGCGIASGLNTDGADLCYSNSDGVCEGAGITDEGQPCKADGDCQGYCKMMDPCASDNPPMWCPNYSGNTTEGDCCGQTWGMPGCSVDAVEACVCAKDSYCCQVEWDGPCVNLAAFCGAVCTFDNPCDGDFPPAYCYGEEADDFDPCDPNSYDGDASQVPDYCATYGGGAVGDCCNANEGQGCNNSGYDSNTDGQDDVSVCVCTDDPWCCGQEAESPGEGEWDLVCVKMAHDCIKDMGGSGCFASGDDPCAPDAMGTVPFWCEDEGSWEMEAENDNPCFGSNPAPWCNMWGGGDDTVGTGGGGTGGGGTGGGGPNFQGGGGWGDDTTAVAKGNCCTNTFGTPGCDSGESTDTGSYSACQLDGGGYDAVCESVCARDNYCCNVEWDPPCVTNAAGEGSCMGNDGTVIEGYQDPCGGMNPPPWCGDSDDYDVPDEVCDGGSNDGQECSGDSDCPGGTCKGLDPCDQENAPDWCWEDADPCAVTNPPSWCFDDTTGGDWDTCMANCLPVCYGMGGNNYMCNEMCDDKCGGSTDPCDGDNPPDYCEDYPDDTGGDDYNVGSCSGGNYAGSVCTGDFQCGTGGHCDFPDDGSSTSGYCGNGIVDDGEDCDDGNLSGGDGCNSYCMDEGGGGSDACDTCTDQCENQGGSESQCDSYCVEAGHCTDGGSYGGSY